MTERDRTQQSVTGREMYGQAQTWSPERQVKKNLKKHLFLDNDR